MGNGKFLLWLGVFAALAGTARAAESEQRFSWVPLAGYDPTYGLFVGGGYFHEKVTKKNEIPSAWSAAAVVTQKRNVAKLLSDANLSLGGRWRVRVKNQLMNGFEPNYGLGDETSLADRVDVPFWKDELEVAFPYFLTDHLSIGPGLEGRIRHNRPMLASDLAREKDPVEDRELTGGLFVEEEIDFRDNSKDPSSGWDQVLTVKTVEPYAPPYQHPFTVLDAEVVTYRNLDNPRLVIATALSGGVIFGSPTYLGEFQIGGSKRLRGFYYNRFRGSLYYVQQNELRFPIYKAVSGASFLEFGEATKKTFSRAHVSYGGGLRIGLPPNQVSKIRIDYAMSIDQQGLLVDFGQAF